MPQSKNDEATRCAAYLKAVGDPLRIRIVRALQLGALSVSDLAELLGQEIGVVSHHLRVLYHADIVQTRRDGKYIYYSLNDQFLDVSRRNRNRVLDFGCCRLDVGEAPTK
ncbi:Transcriptional repressor SdpR [Stieleria neptunia]|uniref:Transcriptional repressor SdpR n=1 Tax=Stieleria neptunia TaxID=2527979 RepID=A0A518HV08_9BACT|nr:metalloregulator ArsR/SmtB family transcription factor [Stieleria neptunia]QDV44690.1 Transcriptional repressor SdpR [Stieleria neptunia]